MVGGRGRGRGRSAGRRGRATGRGGSNIGRAPVSDHVTACRVPDAGAEPLDRRRGVSRRVPTAGAEPIARHGRALDRCLPLGVAPYLGQVVGVFVAVSLVVVLILGMQPLLLSLVLGSPPLLGVRRSLGLLDVTCHVSLLGVLLEAVQVRVYHCSSFIFGLLGIDDNYFITVLFALWLGDGWFPFLSLTVAAVNRRKRKMCVEFRRARYEGG